MRIGILQRDCRRLKQRTRHLVCVVELKCSDTTGARRPKRLKRVVFAHVNRGVFYDSEVLGVRLASSTSPRGRLHSVPGIPGSKPHLASAALKGKTAAAPKVRTMRGFGGSRSAVKLADRNQ